MPNSRSSDNATLADRLDLLTEIERIAEQFANIEAQTGWAFDAEWIRLCRVRARVIAQVRGLYLTAAADRVH